MLARALVMIAKNLFSFPNVQLVRKYVCIYALIYTRGIQALIGPDTHVLKTRFINKGDILKRYTVSVEGYLFNENLHVWCKVFSIEVGHLAS
jgi:hypothetical protein